MHEEASPTEAPQVQQMVEEADAPYLDLEGDRELQAYNHVKNRVFVHMPLYNPELLQKIGRH
jgi:benzoyl-CoA reductase/2-hydroxyglutaryl-CoA dehydratase subunit BcrC/BadD/HgdB